MTPSLLPARLDCGTVLRASASWRQEASGPGRPRPRPASAGRLRRWCSGSRGSVAADRFARFGPADGLVHGLSVAWASGRRGRRGGRGSSRPVRHGSTRDRRRAGRSAGPSGRSGRAIRWWLPDRLVADRARRAGQHGPPGHRDLLVGLRLAGEHRHAVTGVAGDQTRGDLAGGVAVDTPVVDEPRPVDAQRDAADPDAPSSVPFPAALQTIEYGPADRRAMSGAGDRSDARDLTGWTRARDPDRCARCALPLRRPP